jgi:hypothetical protein
MAYIQCKAITLDASAQLCMRICEHNTYMSACHTTRFTTQMSVKYTTVITSAGST